MLSNRSLYLELRPLGLIGGVEVVRVVRVEWVVGVVVSSAAFFISVLSLPASNWSSSNPLSFSLSPSLLSDSLNACARVINLSRV